MTTSTMRPGDYEVTLQARLAEVRAARGEARRSRRARRRLPLRRGAVVIGLFATALFAAVTAALVTDSKNCSVEVANKNGYAICTTNQNATAEYLGDSNTTFGSAGTGTFNSFVRVQGSPTEQGYNTNGTLEFDTKSGTWTHAIKVSDIPVVNLDPDGASGPAPFGAYWEIFADINDGNNTPRISLNDLEVWFTTNANLTGYPFAAPTEKVYDFAGAITINDVNQGSGRGDLRYRIPLAGIAIPTGCNYGVATCSTYFVLYNQWGTSGGALSSDGGFEEFKVKQYPTLQIVKNAVGGDGTFTYAVTGPSTPLVPAPDIITAGGTGATPTYIVDPGTYTIDENGPPAGWTLTSSVCSINGGAPTAYTEGSPIILGETTHVVCTFTNTKDAHIIVDKVTSPSGDPQSFSFDATGGTYADFSLTDAATPNDQTLAAGTYGVSETVPAGWTLTSTVCNSSLGGTESAAAIALTAGETVTCTFTNTKQPVGEGCTPGFWKTHTDLWDGVGSPDLSPTYDPGDDFYTVFGITVADGGSLPDTLTLEEAMNLQGGGILALARHAAAAIVNSDASLAYPYTTAQVINIFRDGINASTATPPDDYTLQEALSALQTANELGCPFGVDGTTNTVVTTSGFGLPSLLLASAAATGKVASGRRREQR